MRHIFCALMGVVGGSLFAQDLPVTVGVTDKTSSDYTLDASAGTLELRDPDHHWIWFTHFSRPGDYEVSARVAVAQANAGSVLRVGHWDPQQGEASSAEAMLTATDLDTDTNPQWRPLGTVRIPGLGRHPLFARMLSRAGPSPGLLHAIRVTGPGTVSSASPWEARAKACDPGSTGAGDLRRARYTEVIPRPWPLPSIGGTFVTCQAPGGYLGCQEGFFWSSWENGGVFPDILLAFGGTREFGHEGSGRTISLEDFSLPLDRRRQTLVLHKSDGAGGYLATVCVGEAGQGWYLLGRMRRPTGGTTVSPTLGFLENPGTFNANLLRRNAAWGNPWFFGERASGTLNRWWPASQLKAHLRGPSPTDPPPLPRGTYPWGNTRMRQDLMEMTIGGQIPIARNDTYFPTPTASLPVLPSLNLAYHLTDSHHVHPAPDATANAPYLASLAPLIRDPFSTLDFTFARTSGPAWLTVATDGSLTGTPTTGDAGLNSLTVTATDPEAGLSGEFSVGVYVTEGGNHPPAWLDHPASIQVAATADGADLVPLRFYDPDPGDTHGLAITAGNTGGAFAIDPVRGMLVKNTTPAPQSTWNLAITVTDAGSASDTLALQVTSGPAELTGGAFRENWFVLEGSTVADLTGSTHYPNDPDQVSLVGDLEDHATGKNTGTRVRGWLHPPSAGTYTFWISGDNTAEFWLGTDDTPASAIQRCASTRATSFRNYDARGEQQSAGIPLVAGQRYYVEVLAKRAGASGGTAGSFSVAWQGPGFSREPIAGNDLSAFQHLAPGFTAESLALRPTLTGSSYLEFLRTKLRTLPLHPALVYSKSSGPAWLQVAADGRLTGNPGPGDAGTNAFTLRAAAPGGLVDEATFTIEVSANQAPQFSATPIVLPPIDESMALSHSLADQVTDTNLGPRFDRGDQLIFSLTAAPPWLFIDETGTLFGTPTAADIGLNLFTVAVTDRGQLTTQGAGRITVNDVAIAPLFDADPIQLNAVPGSPFLSNLTSHAYDPDADDTLAFSKLTGPAWLSVSSDGVLGGTPTSADLGLSRFTVEVRDRLSQSDTTTLDITVQDLAPVVYEGFEGADGADVNGFGSGTGWAVDADWDHLGGSTGTAVLGAPNGFPGLPERGRSAALSGGEDLHRDLALTFTVGDNPGEYPELWLSMVIDNPGPIAIGHEYRLALRDDSADLVSFGKEINGRWRLRSGGSAVDFTPGGTSANLGTWFGVLRLAFDGADTIVTAWLAEDSDGGLDLADPTSFPRTGNVALPGSVSFNGIALYSHNTTSARIDEVGVAAGYPALTRLAGDTDLDGEPNYADADDDNDGIPDSWEALHLLNPLLDDSGLNPDGDLFTNGQEFVADTSPNDGDHYPSVAIFIEPDNDRRITFPTSAARVYSVDFTDEGVNDTWFPLESDLPGTGGTMEALDSEGISRRFYRSGVRLP